MLRNVTMTKSILEKDYGCQEVAKEPKRTIMKSPSGQEVIILPNGDISIGDTIKKFKEVRKGQLNVLKVS